MGRNLPTRDIGRAEHNNMDCFFPNILPLRRVEFRNDLRGEPESHYLTTLRGSALPPPAGSRVRLGVHGPIRRARQ